jgi:hypothetical protein
MLQDRIIEIFEDDFLKKQILSFEGARIQKRKAGLCDSEIITLFIAFRSGHFGNF